MKKAIKRVDGRWILNGKQYQDLFGEEKKYFDDFMEMMEEEQKITAKKCQEAQNNSTNRIVKEIQNYQFKQTQFR